MYKFNYLYAEVAVGFAIGFGSSALQQGIDNGVGNVNWRQALEGGVSSAIASALPPLKRKKWRTGRCTHDFTVHPRYCCGEIVSKLST